MMTMSNLAGVLGLGPLVGLMKDASGLNAQSGYSPFWCDLDPQEQLVQQSAWQQQMTKNELADQRLLQEQHMQGRAQNLRRLMELQADPFHMQGLQLGGQGALLDWNEIRAEEKVKHSLDEESPPWSQETCLFLAMVAVAAITYPTIKLILGVL